ncbi:MAG: OmpA family protein [Bacteroidota bacterium]
MRPIFTRLFLAGLLGFSTAAMAQETGEEKRVIITNEATVNTENLDYSPAFYEDGIVFISTKISSKRYRVTDKRIGKNIMSIFRSQRSESGTLMAPEPFSEELLSTVHEGPMTFDRTADNIFFTRNNIKNGKKKKASDGIVKLKIYAARKVNDTWSEIEDLSFNDNESNTAHPAISVDGSVLYFASDRPGGMGGMDIWMVQRRGDDWGTPTNLGPMINTDGDETFPFIHADGTLYFASNGQAGLGGLDLFFSIPGQNGAWNKPESMGKPFNTDKDDFGFIVDRDKKNGYFSSNRDGGLGEDDIYSFYSLDGLDVLSGNVRRDPNATRQIELAIIDEQSGELVPGATINYLLVDELTLAKALVNDTQGQNDNEVLLRLPFEDGSLSGITNDNGVFPAEVKYANYIFNIEKEGFRSRQVVLKADSEVKQFLVTLAEADPNDGQLGMAGDEGLASTNGNGTEGSNGNYNPDESTGAIGDINDLTGATIKEGTVIELPNIYYNFNDARIRPDARPDLDVVAGLMVKYPDMQIELASHTDSRGEDRYNRRLSQKRAENAVRYLVDRGIAASRLTPVGYGEGEIRNRCMDGVDCEENEHQYNRRTEVRITRMSQAVNITFITDTTIPSSDEETTSVTEEAAPATNVTETYSDAEVLVVTGLFRSFRNAEKRLGQVRDLGFGGAEIVDFRSKHMVVAGRYITRNEAEDAASNLNEGGIKTFIKED